VNSPKVLRSTTTRFSPSIAELPLSGAAPTESSTLAASTISDSTHEPRAEIYGPQSTTPFTVYVDEQSYFLIRSNHRRIPPIHSSPNAAFADAASPNAASPNDGFAESRRWRSGVALRYCPPGVVGVARMDCSACGSGASSRCARETAVAPTALRRRRIAGSCRSARAARPARARSRSRF